MPRCPMAATLRPESLRRHLRCPAEIVALRWADVDWEHDKITVHVPKLEHLAGHETRAIPIFPELRPYLEEVWEQAEPGMEWVTTDMGTRASICGHNCCGYSNTPELRRGPSFSRISGLPERPSLTRNTPFMWYVPGLAIPR